MVVLQSFCQLLSNFINSFLICNKIIPGYNFQVSAVLSPFVSLNYQDFHWRCSVFIQEFPMHQGRKQCIQWIGYSIIWKELVCFHFFNQQMDNFNEFEVFPESSVSEILKQKSKERQNNNRQWNQPLQKWTWSCN